MGRKMKVTMIDPPMGWKYGFPRVLPKHLEINTNIKEVQDWMIEEGYPKEVIDAHGDYFPIRFWEEEQPDFNSNSKGLIKVCCEGDGPMTAGCYHDHCAGPTFICPECYMPDPDHKMDCSRNM
jgi:hypothetical protein